jgi:hypothetical protein
MCELPDLLKKDRFPVSSADAFTFPMKSFGLTQLPQADSLAPKEYIFLTLGYRASGWSSNQVCLYVTSF